MKTHRITCLKRAILLFAAPTVLILHSSSFLGSEEPKAQQSYVGEIREPEALDIADLWMSMEINSGDVILTESERLYRLNQLDNRRVYYLVSPDELRGTSPGDGQVLLYVVTYQPSGFVIVAGTDRIEPITAFDANSTFWWDRPEPNILRYLLNRTVEGYRTHLPPFIHSNWSYLRSKLTEGKSRFETCHDVSETAVNVHWETALWGQGWPYNEVVVQNNGGIYVPTGCTNTAWAIKMRFHCWPPGGVGSNGYSDTEGTVQFQHYVNFGSQTYNWASMPESSLTLSNLNVAKLMYHLGVATETNYEPGGSAAGTKENEVQYHFRYKGAEYIYDTTGVAHQAPLIASIRGGLPCLVSSHSHCMVLDGYRDTMAPFWHVNGGNSSPGSPDAFWYNTLLDADIYNSWPYCSPENYIYVDAYWGGTEKGQIQKPYNTFSEGLSAVPTDGFLWLKAGSYATGPLTLDRDMTIRSYEGTATIGMP